MSYILEERQTDDKIIKDLVDSFHLNFGFCLP